MFQSIPASDIVNILPSALAAGGSELSLNTEAYWLLRQTQLSNILTSTLYAMTSVQRQVNTNLLKLTCKVSQVQPLSLILFFLLNT